MELGNSVILLAFAIKFSERSQSMPRQAHDHSFSPRLEDPIMTTLDKRHLGRKAKQWKTSDRGLIPIEEGSNPHHAFLRQLAGHGNYKYGSASFTLHILPLICGYGDHVSDKKTARIKKIRKHRRRARYVIR